MKCDLPRRTQTTESKNSGVTRPYLTKKQKGNRKKLEYLSTDQKKKRLLKNSGCNRQKQIAQKILGGGEGISPVSVVKIGHGRERKGNKPKKRRKSKTKDRKSAGPRS